MGETAVVEKGMWKFAKQIGGIAIPATLQTILQSSILTAVDQMMLGQLGAVNITAIGIAGAYIGLFSIGVGSIAAVAGIMIAQFSGSDDWKKIDKSFSLNMNVAIVLAVIFTILTRTASTGIMKIYTSDQAVIEAGREYLKIMYLYFLPLAAVNIISTMLRCMGKNIQPMMVGVGGGIVNVILDWIFIFGHCGIKPMGIRGSAIATVGSQTLACVVLIIMLFAEYRRCGRKMEFTIRTSGKEMMAFLVILMPVIMDSIFWSVGENVRTILYNRISTTDYTALATTGSAAQIMSGLLSGFSVAAGIVVGRLIGNKDYDDVKTAGKRLCVISLIVGIVISAVLIALRKPYVNIFNINEEIKQKTMQFLLVLYLYIPARAINITMLTGVLRSGGQTKYSMYIGIGCTWLVGMPLALLSGLVFHLPLVWVYAFQSLDEVARCIAAFFLFKSEKWIKRY